MTPSTTTPAAPHAVIEPVKDAKGKIRGYRVNGSTHRTKAAAEQAAAAIEAHLAAMIDANDAANEGRPDEVAPELSADDEARIARDETPEPIALADVPREGDPDAALDAEQIEAETVEQDDVDPSTLTAEARVARMSADELPPLPERPYNERPAGQPAPEPASRRRSGHPRVVAGRVRSRATAATYRAPYDPAERFPALRSHVERLSAAITGLDGLVDAVLAGKDVSEADLKAAGTRVEREVYEAYNAGLPTPAIGSIIGASGGSARGRARRYARKHGLPMPDGATTSTRTPRDRTPLAPVQVSARYSAVLDPVYRAALDGELLALDAAMAHAFVNGVPPRSIGACAGIPSSAVRKRTAAYLTARGQDVPDTEARKAARSALALPELPDD